MPCRVWLSLMLVVAMTGGAAALDAPKLPKSAKKLKGAEIATLYQGLTVSFDNFTMDKPLVGAVTYDVAGGKQSGNYDYGNGEDKGTFTGTIRINGNRFCYKSGTQKEVCVNVYVDGPTIYETNAKGIVTSVNTKH